MYGLSDELIAARTPTQKTGHKHISTTTPEKFFHYRPDKPLCVREFPREVQAITAFARRDKDDKWYVSYAECDVRDGFNRAVGRNVARRKWFAGKREPTKDEPSFSDVFPDAAPRTP